MASDRPNQRTSARSIAALARRPTLSFSASVGRLTGPMAMAAIVLCAVPVKAADPVAGEKVFETKCLNCHAVGDGALNKLGPQLNGLFGRAAGSAPGYVYSKALAASEMVWDEAIFATFIRDPRKMVPRTTMPFAGLRSDREIADLVAYLRDFDADGQRLEQGLSQ